MKLMIITKALLAVSLLTSGVSGWYNHKSIKTIQHCTTEYCNNNAHPPKTYVKTVHKVSKTKLTVTPKPSTRYIIKKHQTKTITQRQTKTYIITARCSTRTVYATRTSTVTRTISRFTTVTSTITDATVTPDATSVLIPPGFISVGADPDNQYTRPEKRELEERHGKTSYPTAIKCTKTVQTVYEYTVTAKRLATTITKYGKTVTARQTKKITKTTYQQKPKTTTITKVSTRTATKTKASTKVVTKKVTAFLPAFTTYFACGPNNHFRGPTGGVDVVVLPGDIEVHAQISYECCAECHKHVNAQGVPDCAGSFFLVNVKKSTGRCWLRLTDVCSYDHHERFTPSKNEPVHAFEGDVSNGPCGRWKVQL